MIQHGCIKPFNIEEFDNILKEAFCIEGSVLIFLSEKYFKFKKYNIIGKVRIIVWEDGLIKGIRANHIFYEDLMDQEWVRKVALPMMNVRIRK